MIGTQDLQSAEGLVAFMEKCQTREEWNRSCDEVKRANNGRYPQAWYGAIVVSGLMAKVTARWGGTDKISVYTD